MNDLDQVRRARLSNNLKAAGWKPNPEGAASNPVKLWIYSVSHGKGPRLITQVGASVYRDMQASSGLIAELSRKYPSAGDAVVSALYEYDRLAAPSEQDRQALTLFLAFYACSTKTWGLVKPLSEVDGAHIFVLDWQTKAGHTTVRPAHHYQAGPMQKDEIAALFNYVLQAHLRLHPADAPADT